MHTQTKLKSSFVTVIVFMRSSLSYVVYAKLAISLWKLFDDCMSDLFYHFTLAFKATICTSHRMHLLSGLRHSLCDELQSWYVN